MTNDSNTSPETPRAAATDAHWTVKAPSGAAGASGEAALQAALTTPCRVLITTAKGRTTAAIPELGVLAQGGDPASAHAEALRQREARIREFAAEGLLDLLPKPGAEPETGRGLFTRLRVFLVKAAIVSALFLGAVNIISGGLRDIGYVLEKKLDSVANWSPEMVEKNRAKAATVAEKLGPTLRELAGAFAQSPARTGTEASGAGQGATSNPGQLQNNATEGR